MTSIFPAATTGSMESLSDLRAGLLDFFVIRKLSAEGREAMRINGFISLRCAGE